MVTSGSNLDCEDIVRFLFFLEIQLLHVIELSFLFCEHKGSQKRR